ncbi:MAG: GNAT family N-acetyltransferase [Gammaproteobacteria bacterium]|nr:GNAT family N-acetyltransferase [Gammaproteobacteria bacterium]
MTPTGIKPEQLEFKQAEHYNLPLVKSFYKKNNMRAQAPKGDLIFIATSNNAIVAALRLHPVKTLYLLRSMCVQADSRHQGIGSALLDHIQTKLNDIECYSFPYTHLSDFYSRANFVIYDAQLVPEAISDKFYRYVNNGKKICLMKHQHNAD